MKQVPQSEESLRDVVCRDADDLHDVFSSILTNLPRLKERAGDSSSRKILADMESSAERGAGIVKQLLAAARNSTDRHALLQPNELIHDMVKILGETFSNSIRISACCDPAVNDIEGDPMELRQVLLNLCVNARDAMPKGGTLLLSSHNVTLQEPVACAGLAGPSGEYVQIQVADSGAGMSEEVQEKIFEPYFTTKEPGEGPGVGLSTTVRILRDHGALLSLESAPGSGTTFSVYFHAKRRLAAPEVSADAQAQAANHHKLVLLVDDEPEICDMCKSILECFDYRVLTAENGMDGLALMELHKDEIFAVVIDMRMPVMDGAATIRAMRQSAPHLRIIAASGLSEEEQSAALQGAAPAVFLKKPYSADQLVSALASFAP